jgi:sugar lactone lactonase YvrE
MKKILRYSFRAILFLLILVVIGLAFVKVRYGLGKAYPDIGADNPAGTAKLEKLITLDYPPGNLAVGQNGHVYFNYHPLIRPTRFSDATVFEWADGKVTPFPSPEMQKEFQGSFGVTIDKQNRLWLIEPATFDFKHTRIWAFDLATKQKVHFYEFPEGVAKYAEEIRVAGDGKHVLLANPGIFRFTTSKLLVYSTEDHSVRVAMDGDASVQPENWMMRTTDGKPYRLMFGLLNFSVGIDGLEISDDQRWVYIASMTHSRLYRVPLSTVLDTNLTPADVAKKVEELGQKPMSDGITVDKDGNVIITDVEHGGLMSFDLATRTASTLVRSKDIRWADGVGCGPDSALYFTDSEIPTYVGEFAGPPEESVLVKNRPYYIYRLKH